MWNLLPEDVKMDCIARVPRCYYPTLSLVSKYFRSLVASPELYARRSLLGCAEYCFYLGFSDRSSSYMSWYTFRSTDKCLARIQSIPCVPIHSICVVVGSNIYMIGGVDNRKATPDVSVISCVSHKCEILPRFRRNVAGRLPIGFFDRKIYLIDYYDDHDPRIMVFDTESRTWGLGGRSKVEAEDRVVGCVGMSGKIYMTTTKNGYICHLNEGEGGAWETDEIMNSEQWIDPCILDDMLYSYDEYKNSLCGFDLKLRCWKKVKGLKGLPQNCFCTRITCCGSKLVVFFQTEFDLSSGKTEIWCAEIAVEKHAGELLGNVERCDMVLVHRFDLIECLAVKI